VHLPPVYYKLAKVKPPYSSEESAVPGKVSPPAPSQSALSPPTSRRPGFSPRSECLPCRGGSIRSAWSFTCPEVVPGREGSAWPAWHGRFGLDLWQGLGSHRASTPGPHSLPLLLVARRLRHVCMHACMCAHAYVCDKGAHRAMHSPRPTPKGHRRRLGHLAEAGALPGDEGKAGEWRQGWGAGLLCRVDGQQ
jgi:hypothetical protein